MASSGRKDREFPKAGTKKAELELRQRRAYSSKKAQASKRGIAFDILWEDIEFPTHCPVLRQKLNYFAPPGDPSGASFDRVDPSRGYVAGNVRIICMRANRIKSDASLAELEALVEYVRTNS